MKPKAKGSGFREPRRDQATHRLGLEKESVHDTYKLRGKLPEPTVCPQCGAVFHKGRWTWAARPAGAHEEACPACHRIRDHCPAGMIHLTGPGFDARKEEILRLVRNQEAEAKREHPLSRILSIDEDQGGTVVTTTDTHLPRRIGAALRRAHHGDLDLNYGQDPRLIRMTWKG
jgi:hypothetical protein